MPPPRILQQDRNQTVILEEDGITVRKVFHGSEPGVASELAARELDRMQHFARALSDLPFATCPRPLELIPGERPQIRMERARGIPLQDHLNGASWEPGLDRHLAETLRSALIRYVQTFDEPYWDFIFRNMFYDPESRVVTFLDFAVPRLYLPALDSFMRHSPLEISMGSLLASSIFEAARPKRMSRLREHRRAYRLAIATLDDLLQNADGLVLTTAGARQAALTAYGLATGYGSLARRNWYRYMGPLLARPSAKLTF
jgi:hypothetical protein